jgi:hypothetical protein
MDLNLFVGIILGAAAALLLVGVAVIARAGGWDRARRGLTIAGRAAQDPAFAARVDELLGVPAAPPPPAVPAAPPPPAKPSGAPLRLLALLQAEARLVDFLLEDISGAGDAQIGQAVRKVHADAAAALRKVATVEPVLAGAEGDTVTVPRGFDPSAVRVLGNVSGEPPFTGQLQHPGWRVTDLRLAAPAAGQDEFVLQSAEVTLP